MPLISSDYCPWCRSKIALSKSPSGNFICAICCCEFNHNFQKWAIGLPVALIVALGLWFVLREFAHNIAFNFAPAIALLLVYRWPSYAIIKQGQEPDVSTQNESFQAKRESRWFMALLFGLVVVVLAILICSIMGIF